MNSAAQGAGSYKDVSMKDKQTKTMTEGGRHTGMCKTAAVTMCRNSKSSAGALG